MTKTNDSKLNFWQWLGIAIIVLGAIFYAWRQFAADEAPVDPVPQETNDVQAETPAPADEPA